MIDIDLQVREIHTKLYSVYKPLSFMHLQRPPLIRYNQVLHLQV